MAWKPPGWGKLDQPRKSGAVLKYLSSNDLAYYQFDREGKVIDECWIKTPAVTWTHEMAITDKFVSLASYALLNKAIKALGAEDRPSYVVFVMTSHEMDLEHMKKEAGTHFRKNAYLVRHFIEPANTAKSFPVLPIDYP